MSPTVSIRTSVRANGHAPAHRALSEFEIPAFTLHLYPQSVDTVCFAREGNALFSPSPVKEIRVKPSPASRCFIVSYSRMVKRWRQKNEKQRTRALRVRVGGWGGSTFEKGHLLVGGIASGGWIKRWHAYSKKISHQAKTKVWNIKSSVLQKNCLILHLSVDSMQELR